MNDLIKSRTEKIHERNQEEAFNELAQFFHNHPSSTVVVFWGSGYVAFKNCDGIHMKYSEDWLGRWPSCTSSIGSAGRLDAEIRHRHIASDTKLLFHKGDKNPLNGCSQIKSLYAAIVDNIFELENRLDKNDWAVEKYGI